MIKPLSMLMFAAEYESANTPTNTLSSRRLPIIMKDTKYSAIAAQQSDKNDKIQSVWLEGQQELPGLVSLTGASSGDTASMPCHMKLVQSSCVDRMNRHSRALPR